MKHLKLILTMLLLSISFASWAQDSLKVTFKERNNAAITNQNLKRRDRNGNMCALVQISAGNIRDYDFVSSVRIDSVEYDEARNVANIFIVPNYQSTTITIVSKEFPAYRIQTGPLQSLHVYDMNISVVRDFGDKTRTLMMPVFSAGGIMNYGIMLAFVKKVGPYFKFKYNFETVSSDLECDDTGALTAGGKGHPYFNGNTTQARMSYTGGLIVRFWQGGKKGSNGFYGFVGGGMGNADQYWQDIDENWIKNADHSHNSFEVEGGLIYRSRAFAIMIGAQTNEFKYLEGNIGIGVMF